MIKEKTAVPNENGEPAEIDRLDKIEAMVTDLFRQLRSDRAVRQVLHDRINEIDSFPLRNMLLRIGTGEEFGRGIHQRIESLEDVEGLQTTRIMEHSEQIAHLTDAIQQLQANELERSERELNAAHEAMAAKRNHPDVPDCGNPDCGQCFEQPAPKRTIKGGWMNVYPVRADGCMTTGCIHADRASADRFSATRLACIHIPDITEGEGL